MTTKTISIDIEAYERLRRARRSRTESFSTVIMRATGPTQTAGALLAALEGAPLMDEVALAHLGRAQSADSPASNS